ETSVLTRAGDEVTLSCSTMIDGQQQCDGTTWLFTGSGNRAVVELVNLGQINQTVNTKADRLKLAANCSLVIKKVREEDVGRYDCQQWKGEDNGAHTLVHDSTVVLSV
uniref:Diverse immunoglobulin domain-containing protein 1.1 n=1 Tax=Fundulus heteroclitus TaxID=8078 RepID=A0A3Q2UJF5_FUNHE